MPLYFFDIWAGGGVNRDPHGIDLPSAGHVWEIAVSMADEIVAARSRPPRAVSVVVRDGSDAVVYRSDHLGGVRVPAAVQPNSGSAAAWAHRVPPASERAAWTRAR